MKLIKLYAWEDFFAERILNVRTNQNGRISKMHVYSSSTRSIGTVSPLIVTMVSFSIYVGIYGNEMDTSTVFTALMLFNTLKEPLSKLAEATNQFSKAWISCKRIEDFFLSQDKENYNTLAPSSLNENIRGTATLREGSDESLRLSDNSFILEKLCASWTHHKEEMNELILKGVTLKFPHGKLIFVIGSVGSGTML